MDNKTTSRNEVLYKCYWIIIIILKDINIERTSYLLITNDINSIAYDLYFTDLAILRCSVTCREWELEQIVVDFYRTLFGLYKVVYSGKSIYSRKF